ncbi:MAG: hypothetical protein GVY10_02140, partial [Verrucomicrobia bacterium]|nr:hypothetical protein [Verrucomicrobiota bacterium]
MGLFRYAVAGLGWWLMPLAGWGTGTVTPVMTEAGAALSVTVVRDGT